MTILHPYNTIQRFRRKPIYKFQIIPSERCSYCFPAKYSLQITFRGFVWGDRSIDPIVEKVNSKEELNEWKDEQVNIFYKYLVDQYPQEPIDISDFTIRIEKVNTSSD